MHHKNASHIHKGILTLLRLYSVLQKRRQIITGFKNVIHSISLLYSNIILNSIGILLNIIF